MESQNNAQFFPRAKSAPARIMRKSVRFAHIEGKISYNQATAKVDIIPPAKKITPESINAFCDTLRKIDTQVKTIFIGSEYMKHELHKKIIDVLVIFISNENYQIRELFLRNIIITSEIKKLFTAIGSNQTLVTLDLRNTFKNSYSFTPTKLFIKPDLLELLFLAIIKHPNLKSLNISGRGIGFDTKITKSLTSLAKVIAATNKEWNLRNLKILDKSNLLPNANTETYTQKQIDNINLLHAFVCSMLIECPTIENVDILKDKINQILKKYLTDNILIDLAVKTLQHKNLLQEETYLNLEAENLQPETRCSL